MESHDNGIESRVEVELRGLSIYTHHGVSDSEQAAITFERLGALALRDEVVQWVVEAQAPNSIYPAGYRKNSFSPGDQVTVTVNPVTNGRPYGRIASVVLADGTKLGGEGRGRGAAAQ